MYNQRPGRPYWFSYQPENTNLAEEIEILLPFKFREIPFRGFRGEVECMKIKLKTRDNGRRMDDGQRMIIVVESFILIFLFI